jgi:hypothetical protein
MSNPIADFLTRYQAGAVGNTPVQPTLPDADDEEAPATAVERNVEQPEAKWEPIIVPEAGARPGEHPVRFIDGAQTQEPVLCLRAPRGWPIPLLVGEVGAVCLRLTGQQFVREFVAIERVLSLVADPFPWEQVEAFAGDLLNRPELQLRVLCANMPDRQHSPFDYEIMRNQARSRMMQEMTTLERLAVAVDRSVPTLIDGPINRVMGNPAPLSPLMVGVSKTQTVNFLHERGWITLLNLRPGQRTPVFRHEIRQDDLSFPVASWYLKLAGGANLAPNWGYVRVEVPWGQFQEQFAGSFAWVNRLSRWLMDARCRSASYARMPVALEPIVRAEENLKPLFTPVPVLVNRLYRTAGFFRGHET